MSCSRGTPFSALSWRRAPTKSRLMSSTSQLVVDPGRPVPANRKKDVGVTHVMERRGRSWAEYTPPGPCPSSAGPGAGWNAAPAASDGPSAAGGDRFRAAPRGRVAARHVLLEQLDETLHDVLAAVRVVQLAVDEHGCHRR